MKLTGDDAIVVICSTMRHRLGDAKANMPGDRPRRAELSQRLLGHGMNALGIVDLTAGVWNRLNRGDLEVALLPGPVAGPNLECRSLGFIRYDWMASPSLNVPDQLLTPTDLAAWPIISLGRESNLHDIIEAWFRHHEAHPRRIDVCNSLGVVASLTMAGLGIAMLPPSIFAGEQRLKTPETSPRLEDLEFVAAYPRNTESPLIRFIVDMAQIVSTFGAAA